jgi:hypothetical protein
MTHTVKVITVRRRFTCKACCRVSNFCPVSASPTTAPPPSWRWIERKGNKEGRKEGRKGRKEGREEGRKEGRTSGAVDRKEGRKEVMEGRKGGRKKERKEGK